MKVAVNPNMVDRVIHLDSDFLEHALGKNYKKKIEQEMKIYCDCEEPDNEPYYVEKIRIKGVGMVKHHGWVCGYCNKYVQVG